MNDRKKILENLQKRIIQLENEGDYYSAFILLAKYLFVKIDDYLEENFGVVPKNHEERFELCEKYLGMDFVRDLKRFWSIYRESYSVFIDEVRYYEAKLIVSKILSRVG